MDDQLFTLPDDGGTHLDPEVARMYKNGVARLMMLKPELNVNQLLHDYRPIVRHITHEGGGEVFDGGVVIDFVETLTYFREALN